MKFFPPFFRIDIVIGFCDEQFPLEGTTLGDKQNSIGMMTKNGIKYDGQFGKWKENNCSGGKFIVGDVIGIGLIHSMGNNSSLKCFATCNGQFLG